MILIDWFLYQCNDSIQNVERSILTKIAFIPYLFEQLKVTLLLQLLPISSCVKLVISFSEQYALLYY